ncbi:GIY-YIG nuclease family protein [Streptomyces racemochromogenes]|uniref:GIY-YIG nuclease family protein n=1 Tax=Streptomyces racemochromogenes TaxID=67353 RepID=UPI0031E6D6DD
MSPAVGRIYALSDPRDGVVRYVGQTTKALEERLAGHLSSPASKVAPWIAELREAGIAPLITILREDVPVAELLVAEREEITRRVVAGEPLLNQASTAAGRRIVEREQAELKAKQRESAWAELARNCREALGGPLAPGDVSGLPLEEAVQEALLRLQAAEDPEGDALTGGLSSQIRLLRTQQRVSEELWRNCRSVWGRLRGADDGLDFHLTSLVSHVARRPDMPSADALRYLSLIPWAVSAAAPWAALAQRAGMSLEPAAFSAWAGGRAEVAAALSDLGLYYPEIFTVLASRENPSDRWRASSHLAAAVAAHTSGQVPDVVAQDVRSVLREIARDKMLTPAMAELLASLDPRALEEIFGPDAARAADAQLGLPPGTAVQVLRFVLEHKGIGHLGVLDRVVARAAEVLPSAPYPDYSTWYGRGIPSARAITASLADAGLISLPDDSSWPQVLRELREMWQTT